MIIVKPMIITKNEEMKRVFGLGYPSAPIYTVEEFGERQAQLMAQQQANQTAPIERDPNREMNEAEEMAERARLQRWDEHKDHTRRGDGNRKNMG